MGFENLKGLFQGVADRKITGVCKCKQKLKKEFPEVRIV